VDEIKQRPGALDALRRLGINHCCGGHLSLRVAAGAAGVELQTLLDALR
jgi:iron-sulfur cluster repair protein YtfE (RIC family)